MIEAVVAGSELPVLHVTYQVLREQRVAVPEAIRKIYAAACTLLSRTREAFHGTADVGSIEIYTEHDVRGETGGDAPEVVAAVGADEVRDHMPSSPIATGELVVIERNGRSPRVLESSV